MKALVVYYSRSGTTRKLAESISTALNCDVEEIYDTRKRNGILGFLHCGYEAYRKKTTVLKEVKNNPATYDVVLIGTPVWSSNVSSPIRTYLLQFKENFRQVAFFATSGSGEADKTFKEMETVCNKKPLCTLVLKREEVFTSQLDAKSRKFAEELVLKAKS